tara:strand:- start:853 stop:1083 length:231 start_codon:yes stop_codon:yes gene_type:complete
MKNKKILKSGLKRMAAAFSLAFIGPIMFVLGSNPQLSYVLQISLSIIGILIMLSSILIGFTGIKKILSFFFDKSSE